MINTETKAINEILWALRSKKPLILQQGGSSSGKTWGILYAFISYLLHDRRNEKLLLSVVAETLPHLKKGAMKDFGDILDACGIPVQVNKTDNIYTLPNGSHVEFFSADNETKVRGPRRDFLFINEANSVNWDIYYQLNLRTHETTVLDWNPSGEYWLHDVLLPSMREGELHFTRTTYRDNPALGEKTIREIERLKDIDPQLYRIYGEGKTGQLQGLIYANVAFVLEMPKDLKSEAYGLDFGFTNDPTALIHAGTYGGEIYIDELIYEAGLTNSDICDRMEALRIDKKAIIYADSAEPKSIEEIRRKGWNIRPATKGQGSLNLGIDLLKQYRQNWTHASLNAKKELKNYKWQTDRNGKPTNKPIDAFNHALDALRYWAIENLSAQAKKRVVRIRDFSSYR